MAIVNPNDNDGDSANEAKAYEKLRDEMKKYQALYTTERNEIVLGLLKQADGDDYLNRNDFWKMFSGYKPLKNYETILKMIQFIRTRLNNIVLEILDTFKIPISLSSMGELILSIRKSKDTVDVRERSSITSSGFPKSWTPHPPLT